MLVWNENHLEVNDNRSRAKRTSLLALLKENFDAPASVAPRDQMVAETYSDYLNTVLNESSVTAVLTWGLSDNSWLAKFKPRLDGLPVRPLPFDESLAAKPAWTAISDAFEATHFRR